MSKRGPRKNKESNASGVLTAVQGVPRIVVVWERYMAVVHMGVEENLFIVRPCVFFFISFISFVHSTHDLEVGHHIDPGARRTEVDKPFCDLSCCIFDRINLRKSMEERLMRKSEKGWV